jgi:transglutaminase-like putative cysteine protease
VPLAAGILRSRSDAEERAVLEPETTQLNGFLEDTSLIDWQTPSVFEKARVLCAEPEGDIATARHLFEWVRDEITHSVDAGVDIVTCTASQTLQHGTGLCFAKSHLLAALLRFAGIPTGFVYQRLRSESSRSDFTLHGLCAIYLVGEERWLALDPRGNNASVETEFPVDVSHTQGCFAYTPDASVGEGTYDVIFTRPNKAVVDVLQRVPSLEKVLGFLPDSVQGAALVDLAQGDSTER